MISSTALATVAVSTEYLKEMRPRSSFRWIRAHSVDALVFPERSGAVGAPWDGFIWVKFRVWSAVSKGQNLAKGQNPGR